MLIAVPAERSPNEHRVALVPEGVRRLAQNGVRIAIEHDAGDRAGFPDAAYVDAGAAIVAGAEELYGGADVVAKVRRPSLDEAEMISVGSTLVALLQPSSMDEVLGTLGRREVRALALELVPRITRAQSMDVLSSQSTVAGYKAVLIGAAALGKFLPMLTTAAGTIAPARVFVIGAGVAGLQAIATARRLGAVVSGFDVRAAAREQVQSLGATFVAAELVSPGAEDKGGYARAQRDDEQQRTLAAIANHIQGMDLVITTALIPGQPAPRLITAQMVAAMRPGSVIVDLAAENGGNCELTRGGENVAHNGVSILGPLNLAASLPHHASQMFSKNVVTLLQHLIKDGAMNLDPADEITKAMLITGASSAR